ncbi:nucleotidyltransferase domain-containing protein [Bacillus mangrovi]|uniref:Nucleotidyltransferase domain-containing protein n=1 Tax=Metabacillus mangrovi TaxID=1491830 RepID=A0A7X2S873_9BACI|nr:nucleotidyltransferase domain-containing protein [Metabacillus mangrovi]MTH55442.1 nucleotidyltransferase domain-containing protein [Metabacillus mangrovi]
MNIPTHLTHLESAHNIKICYAAEAGSRAFGYASEASDYDVRFIYIHPPEWYLSIDRGRDVIEAPISEKLDMSGWEITKGLRLYRKSNPSLLEWLQADTVYADRFSFSEALRGIQHFRPKQALFHFLHIAGNNEKKVKEGTIPVKALLHMIRSIAGARWIQEYGAFPPNDIRKLEFPFSDEFTRALELKQSGFAGDVPVSASLLAYVKEELEELTRYANLFIQADSDPTEELNRLFQITLKKAWPESRF